MNDYAFDLIEFVIKIEWLICSNCCNDGETEGRVLIVSAGSKTFVMNVVEEKVSSMAPITPSRWFETESELQQLQPPPLILTKEKIEENAAPRKNERQEIFQLKKEMNESMFYLDNQALSRQLQLLGRLNGTVVVWP